MPESTPPPSSSSTTPWRWAPYAAIALCSAVAAYLAYSSRTKSKPTHNPSPPPPLSPTSTSSSLPTASSSDQQCLVLPQATSQQLSASTTGDIDILKSDAKRHFIEGNYCKALSLYDEILSKQPSSADSHLNRARVYLKLGLYECVVINADVAYSIDSSKPEALYIKAIALLSSGKYQDAITSLQLMMKSSFLDKKQRVVAKKKLAECYSKLAQTDQGSQTQNRTDDVKHIDAEPAANNNLCHTSDFSAVFKEMLMFARIKDTKKALISELQNRFSVTEDPIQEICPSLSIDIPFIAEFPLETVCDDARIALTCVLEELGGRMNGKESNSAVQPGETEPGEISCVEETH